MMKLFVALALVAFASASCPNCVAACSAATGADCSDDTMGCAYESTTACGCTSCDNSVDTYRVGCGLDVCSRRLTETSDLEEATPQSAQWGRRRRRFFDNRRRRRRFFDNRRRRRRTNYPAPPPLPPPASSPTRPASTPLALTLPARPPSTP